MARRKHSGYTLHYGDGSPHDCRKNVLSDASWHLKHRASFALLTKEDFEDLLARLDQYYWLNWNKIIKKDNSKGRVLWIARKRLLNAVRPRRVVAWVEFKKGTRVKRVLSNLSLSSAECSNRRRRHPLKPIIEIKLYGGQVDPLAQHGSVELFEIIHDGRAPVDIDAVLARFLGQPPTLRHFWSDLETVLQTLEANHKKAVRVFRLRELEGRAWREVSKIVGSGKDWCRTLDRRCKQLIVTQFPELKDYLRDINGR